MQATQGIAPINGAQLHYEVKGCGQSLVLIHGNALDLRMWDDQMEALSRQYQVIRYEMRGFGRSAPPSTEPYSAADDLSALLSWLGVDHAHILGLSLGGAIAIEFALAYPGMTDTLMVADAGLREFQWESYAEFSKEVRSVAVSAGVEAARQRWLEGELFSLAMAQPQVAARLRQMVEDYSGWHWLNKEPLLAMQPPASERLETIDTPTLVIVGERDIADFQAIAELLCERIPGALKAVIPRVGHMSNMEDPERFNALVLDFMQGHSDWHPGQPVTVSDRR